MFSWITGPRITNVAEDLPDATFIEPPETPAHVFPVRAFKQAIWGTPHPDQEPISNATQPKQQPTKEKPDSKMKRQPKKNASDAQAESQRALAVDHSIAQGLTKPTGILMTPGTAAKGRKTVSFGSHVVDNAGKEAIAGKSGLPNDYPGKFPSPWTPKLTTLEESASRSNKLTEALYNARTPSKPSLDTTSKPRSKDDTDITLDLSQPRSESGKYWKQEYEAYAERSTKEMKKLIDKHKLAKRYAMKKDEEATDLVVRLEQDRKKYAARQRSLEAQNKDLQDQLRRSTAENLRVNQDLISLKQRLASLGANASKSTTRRQEDPQIFEDPAHQLILTTASPIRNNSTRRAPPHRPSTRPLRRRNTSPGPLEPSILLSSRLNTPLQPRPTAASKENIPPAATTKPTAPSSPDVWMQDPADFADYVSPSKLDTLATQPAAAPPSSPFPEPTPQGGMASKARAALAGAALGESQRARRPSTSDGTTIGKSPSTKFARGEHARGYSAQHIRPVSAFGGGDVSGHVRRQSAAAGVGPGAGPGAAEMNISAVRAAGGNGRKMDTERQARARARVEGRMKR